MSSQSKIEWTDSSWSPIRARRRSNGKVGWHCEHATTGCEFCYADGINKRLGTGLPFKPGHRKHIDIFLDEKMLTAPLRWRKPRMIFVCSMTDLFADFVEDEWIDKVFAVMALCEQHTFQVLTKRAERMRDYCLSIKPLDGKPWDRITEIAMDLGYQVRGYRGNGGPVKRPLPNVWLGVSAERQQEADERIPLLLQTPAAVRFVSCEPLLGPIDLMMLKSGERVFDALQGCIGTSIGDGEYDGALPCAKLDWVIDGGESGRGARTYNIEYSRMIERQCVAAGVAYFRKQLGARPFESSPSAWPRGFPMGDGSTNLVPDGDGCYFVEGLKSSKGGDPGEWPLDLRRREFPRVA